MFCNQPLARCRGLIHKTHTERNTKMDMMEMLKAMTDEQKAALAAALGVKATGKDTYRERTLIEISYAEKPSKSVREEMQAAGYHWNSFEKVWFAYKTEASTAFVEKHGIAKA